LAAAYKSAIGPGLLVPRNPPEREGVEPNISNTDANKWTVTEEILYNNQTISPFSHTLAEIQMTEVFSLSTPHTSGGSSEEEGEDHPPQ
jgi:hypothetical protein